MKLRLTHTAARQLNTVLADIARHHLPGANAVRRRSARLWTFSFGIPMLVR